MLGGWGSTKGHGPQAHTSTNMSNNPSSNNPFSTHKQGPTNTYNASYNGSNNRSYSPLASQKQVIPPGADQYTGWLKHAYYGNKEMPLDVIRLPANQAGGDGGFNTRPANQSFNTQQSNEPQIIARLQGKNIEKAFGQDGLNRLTQEVDRRGQMTGKLDLQDPNATHRTQQGTFHLKKVIPGRPNAADPMGLAMMRFGSEKQPSLEHDKGWATWAQKNGITMDKMTPADRDLHNWFEESNNYADMLQQAQDENLDVRASYSGKPRMVWRDIQPQFDEKVASWMYGVSGGRYGLEWSQGEHKAEIEVIDLFEDREFGSPSEHNTKSWWMPGDPNESDPPPAKWERLYDSSSVSASIQSTEGNVYQGAVGAAVPYALPVGGGPGARMCGKIYQGAIEDFYIVQACLAISMKSKLVEDLFMKGNYSAPNCGMTMMRFYKHGQWVPITIDGFLPYDKEDNPMCIRHEDFPSIAWPSLVEKGYAKLHGSWMSLGDKGGDVEDVLVDLTGGCAGRFSATDSAGDRMWKYFQFAKESTIWGCNIDNNQCSIRNIPIAKHWASAIFDVGMHQGIPVVGVFTSAPFSSVRHFPLVDMGDDWDFHLGYMWLRIDDFCQLFSDIYECRLVNSDLSGMPPAQEMVREPIPRPLPPGRPDPQVFRGQKTAGVAGGPWYETLWAFRGDADMSSSPQFLIHATGDTELIMDIGQECSRYQTAQGSKERRSDSQHGVFKVTYSEYIAAMQQGYPGRFSRGQLAEFWDLLPLNQNAHQEAGEHGFILREPQAPLLLRFFQCSADMEFQIGTSQAGHMPMAEARDGEMHQVHMSAWSHTRDAMCCVKIGRTGVYMAQVSMPSQYSCRRLVFRTYSTQPVRVACFHMPRNMIITNAGAPLGAIPYSLTGLPRIDSANDRLPRMFDEDEGTGMKTAGPPWARKIQKKLDGMIGAKPDGGPKVLGKFGGADAVATMSAKETQGWRGG
jgi:hypothetical protein